MPVQYESTRLVVGNDLVLDGVALEVDQEFPGLPVGHVVELDLRTERSDDGHLIRAAVLDCVDHGPAPSDPALGQREAFASVAEQLREQMAGVHVLRETRGL